MEDILLRALEMCTAQAQLQQLQQLEKVIESLPFVLIFRLTTTNMSQWFDVLHRRNGTEIVVGVQRLVCQIHSDSNRLDAETLQ